MFLCTSAFGEDSFLPGLIEFGSTYSEDLGLSFVMDQENYSVYLTQSDFLGRDSTSLVFYTDGSLSDVLTAIQIEDPKDCFVFFHSLGDTYYSHYEPLLISPKQYIFRSGNKQLTLAYLVSYVIIYTHDITVDIRMNWTEVIFSDVVSPRLFGAYREEELDNFYEMEKDSIKITMKDLKSGYLEFYHDVLEVLIDEYQLATNRSFPTESSFTLSPRSISVNAGGKEISQKPVARRGYGPYRIEDLACLIVEYGLADIKFINDGATQDWEGIKTYLGSAIAESTLDRLSERYPKIIPYKFLESPKMLEIYAPVVSGHLLTGALLSRLESMLGREAVLVTIKEKLIADNNSKIQPLNEVLKSLSDEAQMDLLRDWWKVPPSEDVGLVKYDLPANIKVRKSLTQNTIDDKKSSLSYYTKSTQLYSFEDTSPISVQFTRPLNRTKLSTIELMLSCSRSSEGYITIIIHDIEGNVLASSSKTISSLVKMASVKFNFEDLIVPEEFVVIVIVPTYDSTGVKIAGEPTASENLWIGIPGIFSYQLDRLLMPMMSLKFE